MGRQKREKVFREALVLFQSDNKTAIRPVKEITAGRVIEGETCIFDLPGGEENKDQPGIILKLSSEFLL